jgi:hypothetical protein
MNLFPSSKLSVERDAAVPASSSERYAPVTDARALRLETCRSAGTLGEPSALIDMARIAYTDYRAPAAAEAYEIALNYLERSGSIGDAYTASTFLAQELSALVDRGERHKIRLANFAIHSFEKRFHIEQ